MSPSARVDRQDGVTVTPLSRPPLPAGLAVEEFDARDWRKDELIAFARTLGVPVWGKKPALAARVRRKLLARNARTADADAATPEVTPVVAQVIAPSAVVTAAATPAAPSAPVRPQFFRDVPGLTRSQALAAWYASRKASGGASQ